MIQSRRSFLIGAAATLITAPAIVRASSIMPVKAMPTDAELLVLLKRQLDEMVRVTAQAVANSLYGSGTVFVQFGGFNTPVLIPPEDVYLGR